MRYLPLTDADRSAIAESIHQMEKDVQTYVPGYRLLQEPQFEDPTEISGGMSRCSIFVEVEGAGDVLPPYAGNLDIMTAAACRTAEMFAEEILAGHLTLAPVKETAR